MITAVTANAFRHAQTLARSQNLMAAIQEGKIDANFERLIADSVGPNQEAIARRMNGTLPSNRSQMVAGDASFAIQPIGPGKVTIREAPAVVSIAKDPFNGFSSEKKSAWLAMWKNWASANRDTWRRTVMLPEGPVSISSLTLRELGNFKRGESMPAHFQAAAMLPNLLEHSKLAIVETPLGKPEAQEIHKRYAWADFPDGKRRHVMMTVIRWKSDTNADSAYSLEAIEVQDEAVDALAGFDTAASTARAANGDIANLTRFHAGIKPEHRANESPDASGTDTTDAQADTSFSLGKNTESDDTTRHELQDHKDRRDAGTHPEGAASRTRRSEEEIRSIIARANREHQLRYFRMGAEFDVFTVGDEAVLKFPKKEGILTYDRRGNYLRSTGGDAVRLKARIIEVLQGMETTVLPDKNGKVSVFQEWGDEITTGDYAKAYVPGLNVKPEPGGIYRLELDGRVYMISDLHPGNFAKDKNGNVRLIDLMVGEVDPNLTFPVYGDHLPLSPTPASSPERNTPTGETIGERLSKLKKRPAADGENLELTIAETIFNRVDKKAAEPQQHPKGQWKGVGVARGHYLLAEELTLTPEEKEILQSPYEILLIHTADGHLLKVRLGTKEDSNLPGKLPPDAIITHNHPGGRGPSDGDLKAALRNPGVTFRIITRNKSGKIEIFSLRATRRLSDTDLELIGNFYMAECNAQGDDARGRRRALDLLAKATEGILVITNRTLP